MIDINDRVRIRQINVSEQVNQTGFTRKDIMKCLDAYGQVVDVYEADTETMYDVLLDIPIETGYCEPILELVCTLEEVERIDERRGKISE